MNLNRQSLLLALCLSLITGVIAAAEPAPPDSKKSGIESRLALALKLFPDADADKDGTLSVNEALAYLDAHPEVKELLQKMTGGGSSSKSAAFAPGAEGTRVFVCGHSYMIFTAGMLPAVSKFAGIAYLSAGQQMIGGSQVIQHWNLPDEKNEAKKALREAIVDVLMLSPNLVLPDEGIDNFTKLGLEKNPKLRVLVQASWVPWDGKAGAGFKNEMRDAVTAEELRGMRDFHHNGWLKKLETQVNVLNASVGKETVHIVPVSAAVFALRERVAEGKAPGVVKQSELFKDDHGHPAPPLALLVTYCHFAAIHQRSPVGLPVPDSIKDRPQAAKLNLLLQQIAWDAVSSYPLSGVKATAANRAPGDALPARENYLLFDSRIIASTENAQLVPGPVTKHPANPLMREDRPWEVRFDNLYANVIRDAQTGLFRCWYSPFIVDPAVQETPPAQRATVRYKPRDREMGICYAESRDGLKWEKPALGLVEFDGRRDNNLVLRGPHGASVLLDAREPDPQRRYKLFCRVSDKEKIMASAFSPDGLRWSALQPCEETHVPGDTHNVAFWSPEAGKYVGITRLKTDQRLVARTESTDFVHWARAVEVLRGDVTQQTYAMPVLREAGVYLGFLAIFNPRTDRVHGELAWSADTLTWQRIAPGRAFLPLSEKEGDYDWGCIYAAAPVVLEDEIRIYYGASNGPHTGWREGFLALATLRPDGWAGYEPADAAQPAVVTTRPVPRSGRALRLSADVNPGGSLRATVLDSVGKVVAASQPLTASVTRATVAELPAGSDPVSVRFELQNARVYSFSIRD